MQAAAAPHPEDDQLQRQQRGFQLPPADPHHDQAFPGLIAFFQGEIGDGIVLIPQLEPLHLVNRPLGR